MAMQQYMNMVEPDARTLHGARPRDEAGNRRYIGGGESNVGALAALSL
jgi:hypothetical protein